MGATWAPPLSLLLWMALPCLLRGQGVVTLVDTSHVVREGQMFMVHVRKAGTAASAINVVVEIVNPSQHGGQDFVGFSRPTVVPAGMDQVEQAVDFTVRDDDIAEPDETFQLRLKVTNGDGVLGTPSVGTVTIAANDDAFGVFSFLEIFPTVVTESRDDSPNFAIFNVRRIGGIFGEVNITFQVLGAGSEALAGVDVLPASGVLKFISEQTSAQLRLEIVSDDVPENDESFRILLLNAVGGQSIDPTAGGPRVQGPDATLMIGRNDAPLRFSQAEYRTDERDAIYSFTLTIYRGLDAAATSIVGPIADPATVNYRFISLSATLGDDFLGTNGSIGFSQGITEATILVQILPDDLPEVAERFEVRLEEPSGDAVIVDPGRAIVVIEANDQPNGILRIVTDDVHPVIGPVVYIDEDEPNAPTDIVVTRGLGRFGVVTVGWILTSENSDGDVATDLTPTSGTLTFLDGQQDATIRLNVVRDREVEPAEHFRLELVPGSVTGGARLEETVGVDVILEDSDDIYGVVDVASEMFESMAFPRALEIGLVRTGGGVGAIRVNYTAEYVVDNVSTTDPFERPMPSSVTLRSGELARSFRLNVRDDAFLQYESNFRVTLMGVELLNEPDLGAYNSPRLGRTKTLRIPITEEAANSMVGFANTTDREVMEPDGQIIPVLQVFLQLKREGTNGLVEVQWILEGSGENADRVTPEDTGATFGSVTMASGQSEANIIIEIMPDDLPETDEQITVRLTQVSPAGIQRIKSGADSVNVIIEKNDMPGGTFEFAPEMASTYTVQEDGIAVDVTVVRYGGSLIASQIQHIIEPNGDEEFYGATHVMSFEPGETIKTSTIIARGDGIAELIEHFQLRLAPYRDYEVSIGQKSSINITVLENDDPYGVFHFMASSLDVHIDESKGPMNRSAFISVERSSGLFNTVSVRWQVVEPEAAADLGPLSGTLVFLPGQRTAVFRVQSIADEIPEDAETFTVNLTDPTNGAQIGLPQYAQVTIDENDHPIFFKEPSTVKVSEPGQVTLTVARRGSLEVEVRVKIRTIDGTASEGDHDYIPLEETIVTFGIGQAEYQLIVRSRDDSLPETDETFFVVLYDPEAPDIDGDVSVYGGDRATVIIMANDNANGIFRFVPPFSLATTEGVPVEFDIRRDGGIFSEVQVHWQVFDQQTGAPLDDGGDFYEATGNVSFADQQQVAPLVIAPATDQIPEYSESFTIRLTHVTGGGPSGQQGSLAVSDLEVVLEVQQNDDPSGVFTFAEGSREVGLPEDVEDGEEEKTRAQLTVLRRQGSVGDVMVAWEIFSYQISVAGNLPTMRDLLFLGNFPENVTEVFEERRDGTGSLALAFTGCSVCYVTVPPESQMPAATIEDGFSLSAWIRPLPFTDGYILAKTSPDGTRQYYALRLSTTALITRLEFRYSVRSSPSNQVASHTTARVIQDNQWHHLLLTIDSALVEFFIDGQSLEASRLVEESTVDGPGILLVGAIAPGAELFTGLMQDVKVFSRKLDLSEIDELHEVPARDDVRPISGYLRFAEGVQEQIITVFSKDDKEEEPNEPFSVQLTSARGGARVSNVDGTAVLTVLKSDNANGLFGFSGPCLPLSPGSEGSVWECPVVRGRGDAGSVTIFWDVVGPGEQNDEEAAEDFINATGTLVFQPGERAGVVQVEGYEDDSPELAETFRVRLTSVRSSDGLVGSTATSGASIDPVSDRALIVMPDNDDPYGRLEFSTGAPPADDDPITPPSDVPPSVTVPEESGIVRLLVVRTQGTVGQVTVEWRTVDGTAVSSGKNPPDYVAQVALLTFQPRQRYAYVEVALRDNTIPENVKTFYVELVNPGGGATVGLGGRITVNIDHSDQAYGVFQFDDASVEVITPENGGSDGYREVALNVIREGGTIGAANVTWAVLGNGVEDLAETAGLLSFQHGQQEAQLLLRVRDDSVAELQEDFVVQLMSASQGTIGSQNVALVIVEASDDPYGVYILSAAARPVRTPEEDTEVTFFVERREFSGLFGRVNVTWRTLAAAELYPYLPGGTLRAQPSDFAETSGWVVFEPGETSSSFNLSIYDDDEPEVDESVFVLLTGADLIQGDQQAPVFDSPRLGRQPEIYGQVIIEPNDNPAGVLQLSAEQLSISEDFAGAVLYVNRSAGTFGQVTVKFEVVQGSATYGLDYSITSTDVVLDRGEQAKRLPVEIINDRIPELEESFSVRLLDQITGGAVLGAIREAVVIITASDDPFGAFAFEESQRSVEEPPDGGRVVVSLPVVRRGGTVGVIAVQWQATLDGVEPTGDITPTSGTVFFVSNDARQNVTVTVNPDTDPEGLERIVFTLLEATNGGRIDQGRHQAVLTVLPNDNPHGMLEFEVDNFIVQESDVDAPQYIEVSRVGGTYGEVRVFYETSDLDLLTLALKEGRTVFSYYFAPISGKLELPAAATRYNVGGLSNPLLMCATFCLMSEACLSFDFNPAGPDCNWYTVSDTIFLTDRQGYSYYQTDQVEKRALFARRASPGLDYEPVAESNVILNDGVTVGLLPVNILADDIPELPELFQIHITRVELVGGPPRNPSNLPSLGNRRNATVTVAKNDNANGILRIYSRDPRATNDGSIIEVEERERLAVELIVERQDGTIGEVQVTWYINASVTTATRGQDFIADGATLRFEAGDTQRTLTIGIEDDVIPENDEFIVVQLRDPQGGATIAEANSATVVIQANDNVAGRLYFTKTSYLVEEGDTLIVTVERSEPALGDVRVDWVLTTTNSQPPEIRFNIINGSLTFLHGENQNEVRIVVLVDNQPKINQEYELTLFNVRTEGVRDSGAAGVDPQNSVAIVTIEGGNEPHGVFSFATSSQHLLVSEAITTAQLTVDRKFGAIGAVRVYYEVQTGSLSPLSPNLQAAIPLADFAPVASDYVVVGDGENSGVIPVRIYDDDTPEVDEVFLVTITGVLLEALPESNFLPKLAETGNVAEVIVEANDGTFGEVVFSAQSERMFIEEETINITLAVLRNRGTFGDVSVFCFAQSLPDGAIRGQDFNFEPREIAFAAGETVKYVVVALYDDDEPEPNEQLEIILASPQGGVTVGALKKATITILASDRASGVVSFESSDVITLNEPTSLSAANTRGELRLTRAPGVFGVVNVPYEVRTQAGSDNVTDLTPIGGYVTFRDREGVVTLELTVVADDIPEEEETFIVTLFPPDEASLGLITQRTIVIERNDAPYGLLQIYPVGTRNHSVTVEEGNRVLYLDVFRSQGSTDEVSVNVVTRATTAHVQQGPDLMVSTIQQLNVRDLGGWSSFNMGDQTYLVLLYQHQRAPLTTPIGSTGAGRPVNLANITQTVLFRWQGAAVLVQSIETDGATSATGFTIEGATYLFITNAGGRTRHVTTSRLYRLNPDGTLEVIQDLRTRGAKDAVYFNKGSDHFLVVANSMDDTGRTNINSDVYQWDYFAQRFSPTPVQYLPTRGASAVEVIVVDNVVFLIVANGHDAESQTYEINSLVYRLDANNRFTIHQQIPTKGAVALTSFRIGSDPYMVIANGQDDDNRYHQMATVYAWNRITELFSPVQEVAVASAGKLHSFVTADSRVHLAIAMEKAPSVILTWRDNTARFNQSWVGPPLRQLLPVVVEQRAGSLLLMAEARPINESAPDIVNINQLTRLDLARSDYVHRALTLTFQPGQTHLRTSAVLLEDDTPEDTEALAMELVNPRGGAELGLNKEVIIHILSNDDGHGIIEFGEDSLELYVEEVPTRDTLVQLNVVRRRGTAGRVVVRWRAAGAHNDLHDLSPNEGELEFADSQRVASITLTIRDDQLPEPDELTQITLLQVVETGTPLPGRGARIGEKSSSRVTVMANDSPHGVVAWERSSYITTEPEGTDTTTFLHITRSQGTLGTIRVAYITSQDVTLPTKQQAVSGRDYLPVQSSVDLQDGVTRVPIEITILSDSDPEVAESLLINITGVQLIDGATVGAGASVRRPGNVASLTIAENDDARGIIQFDVVRNLEGRVDTYEGVGSLRLKLIRTVGFYGDVEVAWQASPREASTEQFSPSGGTVTFAEGEDETFIEIAITDDTIAEELQTFDVQLIRVTSGGATLGADNSVRIGIIRNDSPNGIFSFVQTRRTVSESRTPDDADGLVKFDVQRVGTEGDVNLEWRLSADAVDDFEPPLTGNLLFTSGEAFKDISLRTRVDSILEGEEEFTLSLVSADNNGDISPTKGDATVVILADAGAGGRIAVAERSQFLMVGEPSVTYDGRLEVALERRVASYGEVRATWQIIRRDNDAFVKHQDSVVFADGQREAIVILQTKDDNTAERRQTYVFEITSATGGATVDPTARTADIVLVASDFPHGLFEFAAPQETTISEDSIQVTVPVERNFGSQGLVRVEYTTSPGTAVSEETLTPDFGSSRGWLVFGNNQRRQTVVVDIVNDARAEGPEYFFINLTQVELQQSIANNYTIIGGLQLDMAPAIGELDYKMIIIEKNDNAEGIVEFTEEALSFVVAEESGMARVPIIRGPGTFGEVLIKYTTLNVSASLGLDYLLTVRELLLPSGVSRATINVTIIDDQLREFGEQFELTLTEVTGGALLGARTKATVTIAKSDFPNGRFSFDGQTTITIPNPDEERSLPLAISRTGGLIGRQTVYWRIIGPNDPNRLLEETNDVSVTDASGREVTQGILQWEANEDGRKGIVLNIKPHTAWEIMKVFSVVIYDIQGFPADTGSGEASLTGNNFTLIIQKFGRPNGIVRFDGVAQQLRYFEEPVAGNRRVIFPIYRADGTFGDITVHWRVLSVPSNNVTADLLPTSGEAVIQGDKATGEISLAILADDLPELDEVFTVYLTSVDGGGEIDDQYNSSRFTVQHNDYPHGRFSLEQAYQTVVVAPSTLQRSVRLNVTRHDGVVGRVRVSYTIIYDQAQSGISYIPSASAVTFEDGSRFGVVLIEIENKVSIAAGSSFTATLTGAVFIGVGVTMRPQLIAGRTTAKVYVPPEAANSEVGFGNIVLPVDEATNLVDVVVERRGTYAGVQVDWNTGFPDAGRPEGFSLGSISEETGVVIMTNAVNRSSFKVQLTPRLTVPELFALHLPRRPVSQSDSGAELWVGRDLARIEPYGVVRFDAGSRNIDVQELEDRELEVTLGIERVYGSLGAIQVRYNTYSGTALGGEDYGDIQNGAVNMDPQQILSTILIKIKPDNKPEEDEFFFVNFTSITRLPTGLDEGISPRLSTLYSSAMITITRNNDPYGVVSIVARSGETDGKVTEPGSVEFTIVRTGGTFGRISVQVRTIGGGETWDTQVGRTPSSTNDTISDVLANRDLSLRARVDQDYQLLDQTVSFQEGQTEARVLGRVLEDTTAEDDEVFFVYLIPQTEGVRVAQPSLDNGRRGYASVRIRRNDFWNGLIGFSQTNSTRVTADEDSDQPALLTIERRNANIGPLNVTWKARISPYDDSSRSANLDLTQQLQRIEYTIKCPERQRYCVFPVPIRNDAVPENQTSFTVELRHVGDGAQIDSNRRFANVTLLASDNPNGLVQFESSSRDVYVEKSSTSVRLKIERVGYVQKRVSVKVGTLSTTSSDHTVVAGVKIYHALDGSDYSSFHDELLFTPGERSKTITITMDLSRASDNPYPKMFRVVLSDVTNGAVLGVDRATVTIVNQLDLPLWDVWSRTQRFLTNSTIDGIMFDLELAVRERLNAEQLKIVEDNLDKVIRIAETHRLLQGSRISIMSVFCRLLSPDRQDDTQGYWRLNQLLERFAFSYLTEFDCDQCCTASALLYSPECQHVQFAVAKWYSEDINSYGYQARFQDSFIVPDNLLPVQDNGRQSQNPKCRSIAFIDYTSSQWYRRSPGTTLLNNRVLTVSIQGQPSRELSQPVTFTINTNDGNTAPQRAKCVYFDEDIQQWTDRGCSVNNDLSLATQKFVRCSCKHMSSYAVLSEVRNPDLIGYPIWFQLSCFFVVGCLVVVILSHHFCVPHAMFAANLFMHFCFALLATELCYVIDSLLSPRHLLAISNTDNNYRCIVMAIFVHYFFLAQFTWMMMQAINFWKILVLNDEHTERKYVMYFLLGWGLPGLVVFFFGLVTYLIYRYATSLTPDRFYGDVNDNKDICFVVNPYAALAGVIGPILVCLMVVGIVFIQAFQLTPQWQAYDDVYKSRYNIHEIRWLLLFWAMVVLTWLWGGLHMAYGQPWMLILFCLFNVAVGLYALIVYSILRNPCRPCLRPQKSTTYAVNYGPSEIGEPLPFQPVTLPSLAGSVKGSRASLINDAWEKESIHAGINSSALRVKRSPVNGNVFVVPSPPYDTKPTTPRVPSTVTAGPVTDHDSQDFDELIFALKTGGGYTPSDSSHPPHPNELPDPGAEPNYEMRRISIADTHL